MERDATIPVITSCPCGLEWERATNEFFVYHPEILVNWFKTKVNESLELQLWDQNRGAKEPPPPGIFPQRIKPFIEAEAKRDSDILATLLGAEHSTSDRPDGKPDPLTWEECCQEAQRIHGPALDEATWRVIESDHHDAEEKLKSLWQERIEEEFLKANEPVMRRPLFACPEGTSWEELKITFLDGHVIRMQVDDIAEKFNYAELGFKNKRNGNPTEPWKWFAALATKKGIIEPKEVPSSKFLAVQKNVSVFRARLKEITGIPGDPFLEYHLNNRWQTRFKMGEE